MATQPRTISAPSRQIWLRRSDPANPDPPGMWRDMALSVIGNAAARETLPIAGRFQADRFERIDEPLYPPLATRESLANALCHRDYAIGGGSVGVAVYDDRLEVMSSGTLHFGLTPEKLFEPHESLPWNPLIARTFYRRGIIEEWGFVVTKRRNPGARHGYRPISRLSLCPPRSVPANHRPGPHLPFYFGRQLPAKITVPQSHPVPRVFSQVQ